MDSLILIALLILCWILFVTVVSIMALIRFKEYKQEIFMLKREVFLLRDRSNAAPVPQQEEGVPESAPAIV